MEKVYSRLVPAKRRMSWKILSLTLFITIFVFTFGVLVGNAITSNKISDISKIEDDARLQLESIDVEEKLLSNVPCTNPSLLTSNLDALAARLTYLEAQYDKNDSQVIELKKPYTLLEIRHFLKLKDIVNTCGTNYSLVLFFYSNSPENQKVSESQGFVLEYLQKKYTTDKLKVYSIDSDLDMDIVSSIKKLYNISAIPSVVINDKLYSGFHSKEELEGILDRLN